MIGPRRRHRRPRPTCSRTRRRTSPNVAQRAALAAVSGDLDAVAEMRAAFDAARPADARAARRRSRASRASSRRARSTASRRSRACSAARSRGRTPTDTLELCEVLLDEAKVAIVPGEAFGAPGYARLSFALGDDDLGRGRRAASPTLLGADASPRRRPDRRRRVASSLERDEAASSSASSSPTAGSTPCAPPGSRSTCSSASRPSELLDAVRGRGGARDPQRDAGHRRGARGRRPISSSSGGPGIGLDNVDVAEATRRGVMVVNAPQSNVLSAAEHTHRAAARAGAQRPAGRRRPARPGSGTASQWEGVELHGKTLGIVGLGRVGVLVAQRAHAFGMRLVAYDPFVSAERARQLGVRARADDRGARRDVPTSSRSTCRRRPRRSGSINAERARARQARRCGSSTPAAAASSTRPRSPTRSATGRIAGAAIDVFATEPTTESPLFELDNVVVTPHLGASTAEAQDKAGQTIAEQVVLALRGEFVPFAVNVAATEASRDRAAVPAARRAARAAVHRPRRRRRRHARDQLRGRDRRLRLPRAHAVGAEGRARRRRRRAGVVRERAAARRGARARRPRDDVVRRRATT